LRAINLKSPSLKYSLGEEGGLGSLSGLDDQRENLQGIRVMSKRNELQRLPLSELAPSVSPSTFDYDSVPLPLAKFLKGQADRIRHQHVTSIVNIGKALLEAKRHLSHGAFQGWVEAEACMPIRTAQAYMRVAHWVSAKNNRVIGRLPPSILYILSAPSTPAEFVSDVLSRLEAGEPIAPSVIRKELRTLRSSRGPDGSFEIEANPADALPMKEWDDVQARRNSSAELSELVTILTERLSSADFERVREIMTSDAVLSDPELSPKLRRVFTSEANCEPANGMLD
jgi:hypothetical protein